jgi:primosomal protein N' (replication factor Y)
LPYARIRVDTGVFHLDQLYDYLIPEKFSELIQVGIRVQLPFGNHETEGIIVERVATPERAGDLKSISKVLSPVPIATAQSLSLIDAVASHYACNPWDVIRSAIPPRVASVDKTFLPDSAHKQNRSKSAVEFQTLAPFIEAHEQLVGLIRNHHDSGSVLVIAPDEKDVDRIIESLRVHSLKVFKLTASMPREERYSNFLQAIHGSNSVVVGTRSAIFAPVNNLSAIIVHKESSLDHYEIRSPGWNTRTIALMRSRSESLKLVLTGFAPSIEVAQLVDDREVKYLNTKEAVNVKSFSPSEGALLPGRIFSEIKKSLEVGPVLFIAPRKGYGNALLCAHCRNVATCDCGGRLSVSAKMKAPSCVHCGKAFQGWKCSFCNRDKQYLAGRGIERAAEEISRAFPKYPVVISAGDVIKADAAATITALHNQSIDVWLLTGDNPEAAAQVGALVGINSDRIIASAKPEDKLSKVSALQSEGKHVLMVGDGINDAAALAQADLSIAMGTGTDTAIATADITIMRPQLMSIVDSLALSKRTLRTIKVNLGWAFAYNAIGIPIAAMGLMSPMYAAAAMAMSSLFVVTNSLRIK